MMKSMDVTAIIKALMAVRDAVVILGLTLAISIFIHALMTMK